MDIKESLSDVCPDCGRHVEILNGDVHFSLELHRQSHKSLETINRSLDKDNEELHQRSSPRGNTYMGSVCPDCNETILIINNDANLSLQLHSEKHRTATPDGSSTSSINIERIPSSNSSSVNTSKPINTSLLDAVFSIMPPDLKTHRGFISERSCGKAFCDVCKTIVQPIFNVSEHLKTKLHEDNTILFLKNNVPIDLQESMEFVSFYKSNLYCNLCQCSINLCSNNPHETIVNILVHNKSKKHTEMKTVDKSCPSDGDLILRTLALVNPLVNDNMHLIEVKVQPHFWCQQCDQNIVYSEDENDLLNNFISHFNSFSHIEKCKAFCVLREFHGLNILGKEKHNLIMSNQKICCTNCNCCLESDIETLISHVKPTFLYQSENKSSEITAWLNNSSSTASNIQSNMSIPLKKEKSSVGSFVAPSKFGTYSTNCDMPISDKNLKELLNSLPGKLKNINYIVSNDQGRLSCQICSCEIPWSTYNLQTHLEGGNHKKNLQDYLASNKYNDYQRKMNTHFLNRNLNPSLATTSGAGVPKLQEPDYNKLPVASYPSISDLFKLLPPTLSNQMTFIKPTQKLNVMICYVCNVRIGAHVNNLKQHLEGNFHTVNVAEKSKKSQEKAIMKLGLCRDFILNLVKTNKVMEEGWKHLVYKNGVYVCTPCDARFKTEGDLKNNLLSHFKGMAHKSNTK